MRNFPPFEEMVSERYNSVGLGGKSRTKAMNWDEGSARVLKYQNAIFSMAGANPAIVPRQECKNEKSLACLSPPRDPPRGFAKKCSSRQYRVITFCSAAGYDA